MTEAVENQELISLTIDGQAVSVPKGTNVIEAAKQVKTEIPHYCYHPHLSVPGNCRMCQVEWVGAPKLMIGCHLQVQEGMEIKTQNTSEKVKKAQESTLEFILINHPLDCTVCDQAGHCKLQDYHFDYNGKSSRFLEEKEKKVKAEPLGPNVILDGERCIMCTRCIRFCDEVTETSELGMLNRGDKSVIAINPGKELNNELSGTVVDLCPVGALTHRNWRFNTRIWYTDEKDTICTGCSTGCNVKVATRDNQIVQVKARMNDEVNKEWLCDEGRYGFDRFLPEERLNTFLLDNQESDLSELTSYVNKLKSKKTLVLLSPDLLLEDFSLIKTFFDGSDSELFVNYFERELNEVEKKLVSPDYACNFMGAKYLGITSDGASYQSALNNLSSYEAVFYIGDKSLPSNLDGDLLKNISEVEGIGFLTNNKNPYISGIKNIFPIKSILETSGLLINRANRLQYATQIVNSPQNALSIWKAFNKISDSKLTKAISDRDLTVEFLNSTEAFKDLSIKQIKGLGVNLNSI